MTEPLHRVALVTCSELPGADPETRSLIEPLAALGVEARATVWSDPAVDWTEFDVAIVRSCWDYSSRREEFVAWAASVPRLENPARVIEWNTDKRYLTGLAERGLPVISTSWVDPTDDWHLPELRDGLLVVKPAVSLSALDSGRYDLADAGQRDAAERHVRRLQQKGRRVMLQPYMSRIDRDGETSLIFIAGWFSHAVRRSAVLDGPDRGLDKRFAANGGIVVEFREPSTRQMMLAERVLRAVGGEEFLYARVDLVPDDEGTPTLMELELTEPHLYLGESPGSLERFAAAIAQRASGSADGLGARIGYRAAAER